MNETFLKQIPGGSKRLEHVAVNFGAAFVVVFVACCPCPVGVAGLSHQLPARRKLWIMGLCDDHV